MGHQDDVERSALTSVTKMRLNVQMFSVKIEWDRVAMKSILFKTIRELQKTDTGIDNAPQTDNPQDWTAWIVRHSRAVRSTALEWTRTASFHGVISEVVGAAVIEEIVRFAGLFGKHALAYKLYCAGVAALITKQSTTLLGQWNIRIPPRFTRLQEVLNYTLGVHVTSQPHSYGSATRAQENDLPDWVRTKAWELWKSSSTTRWWMDGSVDDGSPEVNRVVHGNEALENGRKAAMESKISWAGKKLGDEIQLPWVQLIGREVDGDEDKECFQKTLLA